MDYICDIEPNLVFLSLGNDKQHKENKKQLA